MLNFPVEPQDGDIHEIEGYRFQYHSDVYAWWPEGVTEEINTAVQTTYASRKVDSLNWATVDKELLFLLQRR
jgi:hypothetical protein